MAHRTVVYLGDRFLAPDEPATVSLFDRAYLLGDSVFASLRVYSGHPFGLPLHLSRFALAADELGFARPTAAALDTIAREACARFTGESGYLRVTLSRGEGPAGLSLVGVGAPVLSVVVRELASGTSPEATAADVVRLRAPPAACQEPSWKLGSYAARVAMRREVEARGHREGLVLSIGGELVSGISSNVFLVHGKRLVTPWLSSGCRPGTTREILLRLLAASGARVEEREVSSDDLRRADGAFFTSSLAPVFPVSILAGRRVDPLAASLVAARAAYADAVALGEP